MEDLIERFKLSSSFKSIRIGEAWDDNYERGFKPLNEVYTLNVNGNAFEYNTSAHDLGIE